jgi:uncharacterized coiled-coil DUF342 family protein
VGDDTNQHMEQREDGHNADRSLDTARLYTPRERDRTLIHALQAWSVAQEVRITAAECVTEARALREKADALRTEAQRYRDAVEELRQHQ